MQDKQPTGKLAFTIVWIGQAVSLLGTEMSAFAPTIWAYQLTGKATALALVGFFHVTPLLIMSPIAGAIVDRSNRKFMMMISDLASGLATIAILFLYTTGNLQIWHLYIAPRFVTRLLEGKGPTIYGDGGQTRDFTFVANVIDANCRAATHPNAVAQVFNIGCGQQTSLNQLLDELNRVMGTQYQASYEPGRAGDVRHSVTDVGKAARLLGYAPKVTLRDGLKQVLEWYRKQLSAPTVGS